MIGKYYMAKRPQINDRHLVHHESCPFLNEKNNSIYLGNFNSGEKALIEGEKYFSGTTPCRFCLKEQLENKKVSIIEESVAMIVAIAGDQISQQQIADMFYLFN
jgi:hypothetical protein